LLAAYWPDNVNLAERPSENCPNYEWIREGYDAGIDWDTPNLPGHSCTFVSNSTTGHLAWALPLYQATYLVPGVSIHSFLMFAPSMIVGDPLAAVFGGLLFLTGPVLAAVISSSINEQAAIWCFFSMFQVLVLVVVAFLVVPKNPEIDAKVVHEGGLVKEPIVHQLVSSSQNGIPNGTKYATNVHSDGKKID
jgi:hypothetical protein